jgi:hypothetical protein
VPTLYLKISDKTAAYLDALAAEAGTSKSQVTDLIITAARDLGWTVTPGTPRITDPGRDIGTAAGISHSSTPEG